MFKHIYRSKNKKIPEILLRLVAKEFSIPNKYLVAQLYLDDSLPIEDHFIFALFFDSDGMKEGANAYRAYCNMKQEKNNPPRSCDDPPDQDHLAIFIAGVVAGLNSNR